MEIVMDSTNGEQRMLVTRTEDEMLYVMEVTDLSSGRVIECGMWRGEYARMNFQRDIGLATSHTTI